jgi:hypothetical protein
VNNVIALMSRPILTRCRKLARALVFKQALDGDNAAVREVGDRLDGKPRQQIEVDTNNSNYLYVIREAPMTPEEWGKTYCADGPGVHASREG